MLMSDELKFVFVHVPKCGGTSLRASLRRLEGMQNPLAEQIASMPFTPDRNHQQLAIIRDFRPDVFDRIQRYQSFAVLRDPVSRFPSALAQHHKIFRDGDIGDLSIPELKALTSEVISVLRSDDLVRNRRYIHFERQSRFTHLDGVQVVRNLFRLEHQAALVAEISKVTGTLASPPGESNKSHKFRGPVARAFRLGIPKPVKAALKRHLPVATRRRIDKAFFQPSVTEDKMAAILSPGTLSFIEEFYDEDFGHYKAAN